MTLLQVPFQNASFVCLDSSYFVMVKTNYLIENYTLSLLYLNFFDQYITGRTSHVSLYRRAEAVRPTSSKPLPYRQPKEKQKSRKCLAV